MKNRISGIKAFSGLCILLSLTALWPLRANANPGSQAHNLFVANIGNGNNDGSVTEITTNGTQFLFATNLDFPYGLAFDNKGDLFVADYGSDSIYEYTNGYKLGQAPVIFADNLDGPIGLAIDGAGNLFEADGGSGSIFEFTNGYTLGQTPVTFATNLATPISLTGLAFDRFGNLFAGNDGTGTIFEFPSGYQPGQPPITFANNLFAPTGLTFDRNGNLFVTDGDGTIYKFATNGTQSVFVSGLNSPTGIAFDGFGNLYEGDFGSGDVYYFATNGTQNTFASGLNPTFVAFDPIAVVPTTVLVESSANPAAFGQSVTLTANVNPVFASVSQPSGVVVFWDGAVNLGSAIVSNKTATLTVSGWTVGTHNLQINYSGDANFMASSTATNQIIVPAGTTTVLAVTPNPTVYGQLATLTTMVTAVAPGTGTVGGNVTFYDGITSLGASTLTNGVATLTISNLPAGSHSLTTAYAGNGNYSNSVSSVAAFIVNQASTITVAQSTPNPTVYGQPVTFTATISAVAPGAGTPTGTVTFFDGSAPLGIVSINNGVATVTVSSLSVGTHSIGMSYSGDPNFAANGVATIQVVNPAGTTNTLTVLPNSTVYGQPATLTATLTAVVPGAGIVAGSVTFYDGSTSLGTSSLNNGTATLNISSMAAGTHSLTAVYSSNGSFSNSTSSTVVLVVGLADTTISRHASLDSTVYGQSTTFTAIIVPSAPGAGTPTGSVSFFDGTVNLGSSTINAGTATLTVSSLSAGLHTIQLVYSGDANFLGSSNSLEHLVNPASTFISLALAPQSTVYGQPLALTATVTVAAPGGGTVNGPVTFYSNFNINGSLEGSSTLTNGVATLTITNLPVGLNEVSATYFGNANYSSSTTSTQAGVAEANTTLTAQSSANPSLFGQSVTFTAMLSAVAPGAGTPTGSVNFFDGTSFLGVGTVTNGAATLTVSYLIVGTHTIAMGYSGDTNFLGSSNSISQIVDMAGTTNVLTVAPNPTVYGQAATLTAVVTTVAPGTGTVTGNVTFFDGATSLGTTALSGGVATFSVSSLLAGNHALTAVYTSNGSYSNSTSLIVTQAVNQAATTSTVASDINPSVPGLPVTYTATVSTVAPGAGTPTGTVIFYYNGTNSFGTNVLASGTTSITNAFLPVGSNLVTTVYSGDANFSASTSPALAQTVISLTSTQALNIGVVQHSGTLFLQSGLMLQYFTVSNVTAGTYSAVRLALHLTQPDITVYDATGTNANGDAYVQHNYPVPPYGTVTLAVEYYVANRTTIPNPTVTVTLVPPQQPAPVPAGMVQPIVQSQALSVQNAFLVGFQTQFNATYYVTYSSNMVDWTVVLPSVKGNGSEVQWLDLGPPLTRTPPNSETVRYYKIVNAQSTSKN